MLQGVPGIFSSSGDGGVPPAQVHRSGGGVAGGGGGFSEEGDRSSGGNRWPRQETLALLKIRSDMDEAFRDSSLKGPLWDEVSRKLAELGYHRSAKKCREKFENVFKYHKRTKDGRTSKSVGKTYRFFDQLEALEANPAATGHPQPAAAAMLNQATSTVSSVIAAGSHQNNVNPISVAAPSTVAMPTMNHTSVFPFSDTSDSTSSSTFSDEEAPEKTRKRKRKWKDLFGRLMKEVIEKQEELQMKFLETLERRDRERAAREEAWRMEEMAKINREHELLAQERSVAAAKDAAVITFLQKITEQNPNAAAAAIPVLQQQPNPQTPLPPPPPQPLQQQNPQPPPQPLQQQNPQPPPPPQCSHPVAVPVHVPVSEPAPALPVVKNLDNGGENMMSPSPSRWPKAEINALISLRTTLDTKYQENGPKGPLWEEISAAMKKLGYNRNAKRCKEKWENINKYYKKVKESSKRRAEDSKTCPYFNQLDAIYREKANNPGFAIKPGTQMAPIMAQPEQQWPIPAMIQVQQQQQRSTTNESIGRGMVDQNNDDDYDDDDEEDDDEEDEGGEFEIVPNKASSMAAVE